MFKLKKVIFKFKSPWGIAAVYEHKSVCFMLKEENKNGRETVCCV